MSPVPIFSKVLILTPILQEEEQKAQTLNKKENIMSKDAFCSSSFNMDAKVETSLN